MKKLLCLILSAVLLVSSLTACGANTPPATPDNGDTTPDTPEVPEEKPEEKPEVDMGIWHQGYIGSRDNLDYPETINENEKTYVYSDVIPLAAPGTKASFTAANVAKDIYDTYSVSLWMRDGDGWVIDPDAISLGGSSPLVVTDNSDPLLLVGESDRKCLFYQMNVTVERPEKLINKIGVECIKQSFIHNRIHLRIHINLHFQL